MIDPRTGRPLGDHGTGEQAVDWVLNHADIDTRCQPDQFLKGWREGDLLEYPEFYEWLAKQPTVPLSSLPSDIIESLLAIGPVEWGVSLTQSDEKHAYDLLDTLRVTREHFGVIDKETGIHGVYLEGTGTVLAHTGMSPNSPQHARILAGAWNQLVEIAKAHAAAPEGDG